MKRAQAQIIQLREDHQGVGPALHAWSPDMNQIASAGINRVIHLLDRQGHKISEHALDTSGNVLQIEWDFESEILAILQDGSGVTL